MSSTVSKSINIAYGNALTYMSKSSNSVALDYSSGNMIFFTYGGERLYATLKDNALTLLYPNNTANPYQSSGDYNIHSNNSLITEYVNLQYNSTNVKTASTKSTTYQAQSFTSTASAVTSSTKSSTIRLEMYMSSSWARMGYVSHLNLTHRFYKYDFTASTGTGISSATATNTTSTSDAYNTATGFNGDTITFTATVSSGYEFTGWYNGSTLVSTSNPYTVTVSSADVTLTAKAEITRKAVIFKYGSTEIYNEVSQITGLAINYNGSQIASGFGNHTLQCSNKVCSSDIAVTLYSKSSSGSIIRYSKNIETDGKFTENNIVVYASDPITNVVDTNRSQFASGWNGTTDTTHVLYGSQSLKITGTTSTVEVVVSATAACLSLVQNHIYYLRVHEYHEDSTFDNYGQFQLYCPIAEPSWGNLSFGSANQWNTLSTVYTWSSWTSGTYQPRVDFNNDSVAGSVWYSGLMVIDLTAAFGSGNEPSKAWCDANIGYFS